MIVSTNSKVFSCFLIKIWQQINLEKFKLNGIIQSLFILLRFIIGKNKVLQLTLGKDESSE